MTKWEYRLEESEGRWDITADTLNALGSDGWEVVAVEFFSGVGGGIAKVLLKRPVSS